MPQFAALTSSASLDALPLVLLTAAVFPLLTAVRLFWPGGGAAAERAPAAGVLALSVAVWALAYAAELIVSGPTASLWMHRLAWLGAVAAPPAALLAALRATHGPAQPSAGLVLLVSVLPTATLVLAVTSHEQQLLWQSVALAQVGSLTPITTVPGPWNTIHVGYAALCLALGCAALTRHYLSQTPARIRMALATLLGFALPAAVFALRAAAPERIPLDPTPVAFVVTAVLVGRAARSESAFDLLGLAHSAVIEQLGHGVLIVDAGGRILDANPIARDLLGLSGGECDPDALASPALRRLVQDPELTEEELVFGDDAGDSHHFEVRVSRLGGPREPGTPRVITLREITDRRRAEQKLRRLAYQDPLTGLANRRRFMERLATALTAASADGEMLALLYMDLDRFKEVNDTLGHAAGDQLLRAVAQRLRQLVRPLATGVSPHAYPLIARLAGDEFAVILPEIERAEVAGELAARIVRAVSDPVPTTEGDVDVSASAGIAIFPSDGTDAESLLRNADAALYHAKEIGRGSFQFFRPSLSSGTSRRVTLQRQLQRAVESREFELHYQPKVDLATGAIIGGEALLRWDSPSCGSVSPKEFIPVAEKSGLIVPLGTWVIEEACRQLAAWRDAGLRAVPVAVNVSSAQFGADDFYEVVTSALRSHGVEPHLLELELTESVIIQDDEAMAVRLRDLRSMGLRIALDDFGTGYSALSYLSRFPLDTLKMDRCFVRDLDTNPGAQGIASAVITMAHSLNLRVVAEGVDCDDHINILREMQCDEIQGFVFAGPAPAERFAEYLADADDPASEVRHFAVERIAAPPQTTPAEAPDEEGGRPLSIVRYALIVDDEERSLGALALQLTRLGVLVLYTPFEDEGVLLAIQEQGRIRALVVSPAVPIDYTERLLAQLAASVDEGSPSLVVVGPEPDEAAQEAFRNIGARWALWDPVDENELRFVTHAAMALPWEMARRRVDRAPVNIPVWLHSEETRALGQLISLSVGGGFIELDETVDVGTRLALELALGDRSIEVEAEVIYANLRSADWTLSYPRGVGITFDKLEEEDLAVLQQLVAEGLARCSLGAPAEAGAASPSTDEP